MSVSFFMSKKLEFISGILENYLDLYRFLENLFKDYNIDLEICDRFFSVFNDDSPIIQIVTEDNFDEILKSSKEMRNNIRGQDIGGLG